MQQEMKGAAGRAVRLFVVTEGGGGKAPTVIAQSWENSASVWKRGQ